MTQLTFNNNAAQYGTNIASYAVRIVKEGTLVNKISLIDVASGLKHDESLNFDLVDIDNQIMNLQESSVKVVPIQSNTSIEGTVETKFSNGSASFDNLIFKASTGAQGVQFRVTSKAIDSTILAQVLDNSMGEYDNIIHTNFRYCMSGEIENQSKQ